MRPPLIALVFLVALVFAPAAPAYFQVGGSDGWIQVEAAPAPHVIASVRPGSAVVLRTRPFGPALERVGATTPFGSPRALSVLRTRNGRWLGVTAPELGNNRLGWIDARAGGLRYTRTRLELDVDLSSRTLSVLSGRHVLRRMLVGIGRPGSPTPTGRFAVTDKLSGAAYSGYYGCCILALSATQPNLPAGWSGGDHVAIHGTPSSSDFGHAVSAGCLHAREADLRYLMRMVALGTPVVIRRNLRPRTRTSTRTASSNRRSCGRAQEFARLRSASACSVWRPRRRWSCSCFQARSRSSRI